MCWLLPFLLTAKNASCRSWPGFNPVHFTFSLDPIIGTYKNQNDYRMIFLVFSVNLHDIFISTEFDSVQIRVWGVQLEDLSNGNKLSAIFNIFDILIGNFHESWIAPSFISAFSAQQVGLNFKTDVDMLKKNSKTW